MRFSAFIAACALFLSSEGALRFTEPVWRPDLGFHAPCLADATGCPLDMPRAEAYLVTRDGEQSLEDRFDSFDLWTCRAVRGRWRDAAGNELQIARLDALPPDDVPGTVRTRRSFAGVLGERTFDAKNAAHRDEAAAFVSPVEIGRAVRPRRANRRNLAELVSYTVTNDHALVCAFRPRSPEPRESPGWFLASLTAAPGENMAEVRARFDEEFLDRVSVPAPRVRASLAKPAPPPSKDASESELLRADVRAQVANLDAWRCTDAEDVTVIDDLDPGVRAGFVSQLTNSLPRLRRAYAATVPSPLTATNVLAVVRVFRNREEYLAYVGVEMKWTAAVWSPRRRELVLHHTGEGIPELLATVRHEAFHQHLAYAGSMLSSSPWFNEGHAQLFEHAAFDGKGNLAFRRDPEAAAYVQEYAAELAEVLPDVFEMDYEAFYDGTDADVQAKYRLAWSVAYFLEIGAPKLRFQPYRDFRADYMKALVETRSMSEATHRVLGDEKSRDAFVAAWLAFWRRQ